MAMQLEDIHDQASLDQYWAENGGPPLTQAQTDALARVKDAIVNAAIEWRKSIGSGDSGIVLAAAAGLLTALAVRDYILGTRELDGSEYDARLAELEKHPTGQLLGRRLGLGNPKDPHELLPSS